MAEIIAKYKLAENHQAFDDLAHLIRRFDLDIIKFEQEELKEITNHIWISLLEKTNKLVDNLYQLMNKYAGKQKTYYDYFGFYFKDNRGKPTEIFFGVSHPEGMKSGKPLVLGITSEAPDKLITKYKETVTKIFLQEPVPYKEEEQNEEEDGFVVHLDIRGLGAEPTKVLKDKLEQFLREIFAR